MAEIRPIRLQRQGDGSPKQWSNCAAAAEAMAVLRARKNVNPRISTAPWNTWSLPTMSSRIRQYCDNHFNTGSVAGLYQKWVNAAAKYLYGVSMGYAYAISWATAVAFILDHRGATFTVQYSVILGTRYAGSSSFRGRHRIYVNERRWNSTKRRREFLVYDPLNDGRHAWVPRGPQWMPASLLRKAVQAAGIEISYTNPTA